MRNPFKRRASSVTTDRRAAGAYFVRAAEGHGVSVDEILARVSTSDGSAFVRAVRNDSARALARAAVEYKERRDAS